MSFKGEVTVWHPLDIFSDHLSLDQRFAVVVLNQPLQLPASTYGTLWKNAGLKVAADGGGNCLFQMRATHPAAVPLDLDIVIGDLDSLSRDAENYWKENRADIIHDSDQYSTDFTKAVNHIRTLSKYRSKDIVALGGLGGRVDQGLSVLHHLYMFQREPEYPSGRMFLLSSESITFVLLSGHHKINVKARYPGIELGKHVGIIPLKEASVITTEGLEWDVKDWKTEFGGLISTSNHVKEEWIVIETTKDVLFTIDLVITP